jgi:hypothetical protein
VTDFDKTNFDLMDIYVRIQTPIRFYKEVAGFLWAREVWARFSKNKKVIEVRTISKNVKRDLNIWLNFANDHGRRKSDWWMQSRAGNPKFLKISTNFKIYVILNKSSLNLQNLAIY